MFVFLYGCGDHRHLHSFPTRRSSDLIGDDTPTGSGAYAKLANDPRVFTIASFVKSGFDKDRKSTRLNSSHVRISYAVFCLKKKTPQDRGTPGSDRRGTGALHASP